MGLNLGPENIGSQVLDTHRDRTPRTLHMEIELANNGFIFRAQEHCRHRIGSMSLHDKPFIFKDKIDLLEFITGFVDTFIGAEVERMGPEFTEVPHTTSDAEASEGIEKDNDTCEPEREFSPGGE